MLQGAGRGSRLDLRSQFSRPKATDRPGSPDPAEAVGSGQLQPWKAKIRSGTQSPRALLFRVLLMWSGARMWTKLGGQQPREGSPGPAQEALKSDTTVLGLGM